MEVFRKKKFDVVITDYHMPEMKGCQIVEAVRAMDPNAYVIVITGNPDKKVETAVLSKGAYAFKTKPVDIEEIIQILSRIEIEKSVS